MDHKVGKSGGEVWLLFAFNVLERRAKRVEWNPLENLVTREK
jgi:hypothetical protein